MRTARCIAAAIATLAVAAGPAAAETVDVPFTDPPGDVKLQGTGPFFQAPDILGGRLLFTDGADATRSDDDALGLYATVDATNFGDVDPRLFDGDFLGFFINSDNNPATGANELNLSALGADVRVVIPGVDPSGQPTLGRIDTWNTATRSWTFGPLNVTVSRVGDSMAVILNPASLGLPRGSVFTVKVLSNREANGSIVDQDTAPDGTGVLNMRIPALAAPPPPPAPPPAPPVAIQAPAIATTQARSVATNRATLAGSIDPRGRALTWYFEYGPTARYGNRTARQTIPAGQAGVRAVTSAITRLRPGSRYQYRLVVEADGATQTGANIAVRTASFDRLSISADPDGSCVGGSCRVTGFSVAVRARDGDTNRALRISPGGVLARVRCLSGCSVSARFRLSGGRTMRAEIGRLLRGRSLPSGTTIEVRVTKSGYIGAAYRATFARNDLIDRTCEVRPGGKLVCGRV